jgi:16S rRNA (uracil1498-N3)-methyltransferase
MSVAPPRLVRAPVSQLDAGTRTLPRDTSRYLCRVLRLGAGDAFVAFDPEEHLEADAVVVDPNPLEATIAIGAPRPAAIVARAPLVLVQGLAKGEKVDAIVRDATELGATRIVLARTERAITKIGSGLAPSKLERWRRIVEQAARQCGRADPPAIEDILDWPDALDAATADARFCLDPRAPEPLGARLGTVVKSGASIAFAVGPEGGLTADEIAIARDRGFAPVSIGGFVLRTETVATAVLGAVRVLAGS